MQVKRLEAMKIPSLEAIAGSPFCFRHSLANGSTGLPESLAASIARFGIIEPPLAVKQAPCGGAPYIMVTGHRRLAAALAAGLETAEILVIEDLPPFPPAKRRAGKPHSSGRDGGPCADGPSPGGPEDSPGEEVGPTDSSGEDIGPAIPDRILYIWLEDAAGGALSDMEKILLVRRTLDLTGEGLKRFLPSLSPVFGRRIAASFVPPLMELLRFPGEVLDALHEGKISIGDLLTLFSHPRLDVARAAGIIASEKMTAGQRREAARLMLYLADQGKGPGGKDLLDSFMSECADNGWSLSALRRSCYPRMERDLAEAARLISGIGLPPGASLRPPPEMEGGSYTLEIRVRSERGLREAVEKIAGALDSGAIGKLLDILRGNQRPGK